MDLVILLFHFVILCRRKLALESIDEVQLDCIAFVWDFKYQFEIWHLHHFELATRGADDYYIFIELYFEEKLVELATAEAWIMFEMN